MIAVLTAIALEFSVLGGIAPPPADTTQNVCCVMPNGLQCCSSTIRDGRPTGCGC